jgi:adenine-specific DNA-methyltransferase
MLRLTIQSPKKSVKAFLKDKPLRNEINVFKTNLTGLLDKINIIEKRPKDESEEHLKNDIRDFLRDTYYKGINAINTKEKKDLVIHTGRDTDSDVGVIIEAKRPANSAEMLTADNPNKKAMHEIILYYLEEREQSGNSQLKQLAITNIYEWYIIDANYFDKYIYRNAQIKKLYETKVNDKKDKPFFYEEVAKIIAKMDVDIPCIYFNVRDYENILRNNKKEDDKALIALFKIFSPQVMLKVATPNDSNSLNEKFYKELLHIIGLEETKEGTKNIIRRKKENRNPASLMELAIDAIGTEGSLHRIRDLSDYGETNDDRLFNISLELCITWINRILFLKLLEGQIVNYHQGNDDYKFLNTKTIHDFDELFKLFHKVLAVDINERTETIKNKYSRVPYLNSSLFDFSALEDQTIKINSLDHSAKLELISKTILSDISRTANSLPTLEYLLKFLDAYDFASEGTEDIQEENKNLINASVLGKVFEKINGYKDGSIFTPALITMYMCRQSIRLAVVEKFNESMPIARGLNRGNNFDTFDDVKNYTGGLFKTREILKANEAINSLRICDPAVGSGHFLVSALNEIIAIKAELGILADDKGNRLSGYEIEVARDELVITDHHGNIIEYKLQNGKPVNRDIQRLQKTLFTEKQAIIENCLFGVDINPKSVLICRLRLWIELLKNAYYNEESNYSELETLPNIDINIKCGNSLLSRFDVKADLHDAFNKQQFNLFTYKNAIGTYRNSKNKDEKRELLDLIEKIKKEYTRTIHLKDPLRKKITDVKGQIELAKNNYDLFGKKISEGDKEIQLRRLNLLLQQRVKELDDAENGKLYRNTFEWRFEFPEVLDAGGKFIGFDIIIGNPPYIESRSSAIDEKLKDVILKHIQERRNGDAELITRGCDILIYFFELGLNILKSNGYFSFITQNSWLDTDYGFKFQKFLRNNTKILGVFDNDIKYFDDSANINTIITLFKGNQKKETNKINFVRFNVGFEKAPYKLDEISSSNNIGKVIKVQQKDEILDSIKWGIILNSDDLILDLHKRLFKNTSKIDFTIRIGQGLNLTKDYIISKKAARELKLPNKALIPFFTSDDGAPFSIDGTENFLIDREGLSSHHSLLINERGIKISELGNSTRHIPNLILPRGIGRHFCALNNCNAYSSSFVEIYLNNGEYYEHYRKYIWIFLNSSIGWLIREISGRKNLGGGMLKAEAIDLKNYPLLFNFHNDLKAINKIYKKMSEREAENSLIEINTAEHKEIDSIVFAMFGYTESDKKKIINNLTNLIHLRVTKSKSKI